MSKKYYKLSNAEFTIFTANLLNQAAANDAVLKFPAATTQQLSNDNTELEKELLEKKALEDSLEAKNTSIRERRTRMNKATDELQGDAKNNPNVSNSVIEELGFDPDHSKSPTTPVCAVKNLVVYGTSDGVNHLKWHRNGNKQGTMFLIEAKIGNSDVWVMVNVVTSTKFEHINQTPGVKMQYRIIAKRGDSVSVGSNVAVVYP